MIHGPEKFKLPTVSKDDIEVIVNWNEASKDCGHIKFRMGEKDVIVPRGALIRLAMFLGTEEEQDSLVPTKMVNIKRFEKEVTIRLLKDYKEGESLTIPVSFDVPLSEDIVPVIEMTDNYS